MLKLTMQSGHPIWFNPMHVICITESDREKANAVVTTTEAIEESTEIHVLERPSDVATQLERLLNHYHRS